MYQFKTKCFVFSMNESYLVWKLEKRRSKTFHDLLIDRQKNLWETVLLILFLHGVETTSVKAFVFSSVFSCRMMHCIYFSVLYERWQRNSKINDDEALPPPPPPPYLYLILNHQGGSDASHTPSARTLSSFNTELTHKNFVVLKL